MGWKAEEIQVHGIKNGVKTYESDGEIFNARGLSILTNRLLKRAKSGLYSGLDKKSAQYFLLNALVYMLFVY